MEIAGALLAGTFIGAVLGFVGAGGAMLSVPILIYLFDFSAHQATTAALAVVFAAAASGTIPKFRKKDLLIREALVIWALGSLTNIYLSTIADRISEKFITSGFAIVLTVAGTSMLFTPKYQEMKRMSHLTLFFISLVIGSMTGLFGVGGGFLAIPVLVLAFHTPQAKAAGTSLLIICLNSFTALIAHHALWREVSWRIPLFMALAAVVVAISASHHSSKVDAVVLRKAFAFLLYCIALFTIAQTWII